ncbi:hypothetical protein AAFF_G00023730 [Aldrovandia affinis]|uniref:Uncharacterized protein n=1 Tax=Aldrovandia affinis TaxID=143900 RepID=A0AAD7T5S5_9TELE|nr:hypothetical protein AAFF_G00023730 [Aldrovandia affinis]
MVSRQISDWSYCLVPVGKQMMRGLCKGSVWGQPILDHFPPPAGHARPIHHFTEPLQDLIRPAPMALQLGGHPFCSRGLKIHTRSPGARHQDCSDAHIAGIRVEDEWPVCVRVRQHRDEGRS